MCRSQFCRERNLQDLTVPEKTTWRDACRIMGFLDSLRARVRLDATDVAIVAIVVLGVLNALAAFWDWLSVA